MGRFDNVWATSVPYFLAALMYFGSYSYLTFDPIWAT